MKTMAKMLKALAVVTLGLTIVGCQSGRLGGQVEPYTPEVTRSGAWYASLHGAAEPGTVTGNPGSTKPVYSPTVAGDTPGSPADAIGVLRPMQQGDTVTIYLLGIPDRQQIEDVIDGLGNISLPHVNAIRIEGLTTSEAEVAIREAYIKGEIYTDINVTVVSKNDAFFVRGEVKREGRFELTAGLTLVQGISVAGGYTEFSNPKKVQIMRGGERLRFNVNDIYSGKAADPPIRRGDVIVVPRRWIF